MTHNEYFIEATRIYGNLLDNNRRIVDSHPDRVLMLVTKWN
ncbi:MAG: hypothetical protein AABX10_03170 [Nanoarchaeota archaeon]